MFNFHKVDIIYLAKENNYEGIEKIIKNININFKDKDKKTALFHAVDKDNLNMCKLLIDNGADIYSKDDRHMMAIHYAILREQKAIIEYFMTLDYKYPLEQLKEEAENMTVEDRRIFLNIIKRLF